MTQKALTFTDLVDSGVLSIIRAFGKGEDLRGAVWGIVNGTCNWVAQKRVDEGIMTRAQYEEKYGE